MCVSQVRVKARVRVKQCGLLAGNRDYASVDFGDSDVTLAFY